MLDIPLSLFVRYILQGIPQTAKLLRHEDLLDLDGVVECELPNKNLYDFVGNIRPSGRL